MTFLDAFGCLCTLVDLVRGSGLADLVGSLITPLRHSPVREIPATFEAAPAVLLSAGTW